MQNEKLINNKNMKCKFSEETELTFIMLLITYSYYSFFYRIYYFLFASFNS